MANKKEFKPAAQGVAQTYLHQHADAHAAYTPTQPGGPAVPTGAIPIRRELRIRRVQLLMKPTLHESLKARAQANDISLNQLVHSILEEYEKTHSE
jgi:hypothetical protein